MLKKLLSTTYLLALTATPTYAQAYPIWATAIATNQCNYIANGYTWDAAIDQALIDNVRYADEFSKDKNASKYIVEAGYQICPELLRKAFTEYERRKALPTIDKAPYREL